MYRRSLITLVFLLSLPFAVFAQEEGLEWLDYEDGLVNQLMSDGNTVLVHYTLPSCKACNTQANSIDKLREANPAYEALKFVRVNWDAFEIQPIVRNYDVFGRSTIMIVRTGGTLDSIFADTARSEIQRLMDLGVAPAE